MRHLPNEIDKAGQERDFDKWTKVLFDRTTSAKSLAERKNMLEEFESADKKWSKVKISSKKDLEIVEKMAIELRNELDHLRNTQPRCWEKPLDYPEVFSEYKEQMKNSVKKHRQALSLLEGFSRLEANSKRTDIQSNIDHCIRVLKKGRNFLDFRNKGMLKASLQLFKQNSTASVR